MQLHLLFMVQKQKLSIQFDLSEEYSGYFDVDKLDKVVYNLLSNAAKYTPEGGTILVSQALRRLQLLRHFSVMYLSMKESSIRLEL